MPKLTRPEAIAQYNDAVTQLDRDLAEAASMRHTSKAAALQAGREARERCAEKVNALRADQRS